jgi:hypothetical protein
VSRHEVDVAHDRYRMSGQGMQAAVGSLVVFGEILAWVIGLFRHKTAVCHSQGRNLDQEMQAAAGSLVAVGRLVARAAELANADPRLELDEAERWALLVDLWRAATVLAELVDSAVERSNFDVFSSRVMFGFAELAGSELECSCIADVLAAECEWYWWVAMPQTGQVQR